MPHIRCEIGWSILRRASINGKVMPLIDMLKAAGYVEDEQRAVYVAEPANEAQLELAIRVYLCPDFKLDVEDDVAWTLGGLP